MTNRKKQMTIYRQRVQKLNQQVQEALKGDCDLTLKESQYYEVILQMCLNDVQSGFISTPMNYIEKNGLTQTYIVDEIISKNKEYLLED